MADEIAGLPYWELGFDKRGSLTDDGGLRRAVAQGEVLELFVLVHGWNNSVHSARSLYRDLFTRVARLTQAHADGHLDHVGFVGVLWPSQVLPQDDPTSVAPATTAGGGGAASSLAPVFPQQEEALTQLDELLASAPPDPSRLQEAHRLITDLVTTPDDAPEDAGMAAVTTASTAVLFGHLASLAAPTTGDAQGIGNVFAGLWHGAREALRVASYFEMKNRAGIVGEHGLGPLLAELQASQGQLRVHLLGHSFGGRLVGFALAGLPAPAPGTPSAVKSLLLIQAAFSHFAFADPLPLAASTPHGHLAGFRDRVDGPLMCTSSAADLAVGRWYPAASMVNGQDAESSTDLTYRWGAMGHDGYQQGDAVDQDLLGVGEPYSMAPGGFYRLKSDAVIAAMQSPRFGAHCDIQHDEVVWPSVSAALARR